MSFSSALAVLLGLFYANKKLYKYYFKVEMPKFTHPKLNLNKMKYFWSRNESIVLKY